MVRLATLASLLLVAMTSTAVAGVPSPPNCTLPACLTVCASGDLSFSIVVRDFASNPVSGSTVFLDLSGLPEFVVCAHCADTYVYDPGHRTLRKTTDATGTVTFSICGGGASDAQVPIYADGVLIGYRHLAVTDQDGDLSVDAADVAATNAKIGMAAPSADLDCDGSVTASDEAIVSGHVNHLCLIPTPAQRSTWGSLKSFYR